MGVGVPAQNHINLGARLRQQAVLLVADMRVSAISKSASGRRRRTHSRATSIGGSNR